MGHILRDRRRTQTPAYTEYMMAFVLGHVEKDIIYSAHAGVCVRV
jgi:hypothetical protein